MSKCSTQQAGKATQNSPTVQLAPAEVVSIDGDYVPLTRPRPLPGHGPSTTATTPDLISAPWNRARNRPSDGRDWVEVQSPADNHSVRSDRPSDSDAPTYASQ